MKKYLNCFGLPLVILITACSGEPDEPERVLSFRNAEIYQGKTYAGNEDEPFTGIINGVPITSINASPLVELAATANHVTGDSSTHEHMLQGSILTMVHGGGPHAVCEAKFNDGYLHGNMSCNTTSNDLPILEATYKYGELDGPFVIYSLKDENNNKLAEGELVNGEIDGEYLAYGLKTSKLVLMQKLEMGKAHGSYKRYADNPSNHLTIERTYNQGVIDGSEVAYNVDNGNLIIDRNYEQGDLQGSEKQYDPQTGEMIRSVYIDDVGIIENPNDVDIEECVGNWVDYHNEGKEEPVVWRFDALHELRERCAAGEFPEA